jgi:hypothetical protein
MALALNEFTSAAVNKEAAKSVNCRLIEWVELLPPMDNIFIANFYC